MVQRTMITLALHFLSVLLVTLACTGSALAAPKGQGGGPSGPVALDSPAWGDLMEQPATLADTTNLHAAALAGRWGRPDEAAALRDHLLALHGLALAGSVASGPLADLIARPAPAHGAIQAAWSAGLEQAWPRIDWQAAPPPSAVPASAAMRTAHTGFWRLPDGRLGAHASVRNRTSFVIALAGPVYLELESGRTRLMLVCKSTGGARRWLPDQSGSLWCTGPSSLSDDALADVVNGAPRWNVALPSDPAGWDRWAEQLAGPVSPAVRRLITQRSHCRDQFNCRDGRLPTSDELAAQIEQRVASQHAERTQRDGRRQRAEGLWGLATLLGAFAVYVLIARAVGTTMATAVSIVLLTGASLALFGAARDSTGWGALGMLMLAIATLVYGVLAAFAFRWLYRRFFARG